MTLLLISSWPELRGMVIPSCKRGWQVSFRSLVMYLTKSWDYLTKKGEKMGLKRQPATPATRILDGTKMLIDKELS